MTPPVAAPKTVPTTAEVPHTLTRSVITAKSSAVTKSAPAWWRRKVPTRLSVNPVIDGRADSSWSVDQDLGLTMAARSRARWR